MSRATVERFESPYGGSWELASAEPCSSLRPFFGTYGGYIETSSAITRRLEMPFPRAALILGFGEEISVSPTGEEADLAPGHTGFVAGLSRGPALVESNGSQAGVQVNLTPLGAYHIFGVPMSEITNQVVKLDDLLGPTGRELIERLREAVSWDERFDLLDALFSRALAANSPPTEAIAWAWREIAREPGRVSIRQLANEVGWSHKHLIERFRSEVGLAPKVAGRLVRFDRAVQAISPGTRPHWSDIAVAAGYYDQAHMSREFREFARCTPMELWRRRLDDGGIYGGEIEELSR
ncbi:MAG: helix-turn-helix transcriptional regulator [Dehalococcoidia bacterium]|nr:helix-turn-helix transcriptional regulator [Dehalococcoidia bacterium]